jgi:hypothetical protein
MGACPFSNYASGKTAQEAFNKAVDKAAYESGHGGYTGTIAEKDSFVQIPFVIPDGNLSEAIKAANAYSKKLIDAADQRIDDKWGPAGCIEVGPSKAEPGSMLFLFFGWASS